MLVRKLPTNSELVKALTGQPGWNPTDLLADLWVVQVRAHAAKDSLPDEFDHPVRAALTAKAKTEHKSVLKQRYMNRKSARRKA